AHAGPINPRVSWSGLRRSFATRRSSDLAGTAAAMAANSATSQSATAGTAVGSPPSVIVKDGNGNPVAQVAVTFAVAPGNGTITSGRQSTRANGRHTEGRWTVSGTARPNT